MTPPPSNAKPKRTGVLWALFGFDGRLGRQPYWLAFVLMSLIATLALSPYSELLYRALRLGEEAAFEELGSAPVPILVGVAVIWSEIAIVVKRLHDRGWTGWFAVILPVYPLNVIFFIVMGLIPGEKGPNRFGPGPNTRPA